MTQQNNTDDWQLENVIGQNMGCYYRVATKQWLKEINDPHTKKFSHLIDLTADVKGTAQAITQRIEEAKLDTRIEEREHSWKLINDIRYQNVSLDFAKEVTLERLSASQVERELTASKPASEGE